MILEVAGKWWGRRTWRSIWAMVMFQEIGDRDFVFPVPCLQGY